MRRYLALRALQCLPVVVMVVLAGFVLVRLMPGDPAAAALGLGATDEDLANERRRQGLDRPAAVQLAIYVRQLATLDLPRARSGQPVGEKILEAAKGQEP